MEKVEVFKIGGNVIDDEVKLTDFLKDFSAIPGAKILVHGGGKIATHVASSLGVETTMIEGRRITTDEMIDVVTMTYGGLINKKVTAGLQSMKCDAIGLSGADGNLILSDKRPIKNGVDFGWVGDPKSVNSDLLVDFIEHGRVPVVAPLTHDGSGNMLNTNADTIASALAVALSDSFDVHLNYCFELPGVLQDIDDPTSLIKDLTLALYTKYKSDGAIADGMIPKLDNAFDAIKNGVSSVRIVSHKSIAKLENKHFDDYTNIH